MRRLKLTLLLAVLCAPAFAQHYYFPPPGMTYNPVTGAVGGGSYNATLLGTAFQLNGANGLSAVTDPGGGFSLFVGQGAGTNAGVAGAAKGFFTCMGFNSCGGAGGGNINPGVNIENTAFGWSAGSLWTTGQFDTALGTGAMRNETTGTNNVAVGADSMGLSVGAGNSVGVGVNTLKNGAPSQSVAIGVADLQGGATSTAVNDIAIGFNAMSSAALTTAQQDVAVGFQSMANATTASQDVAVGYNSLNAALTDTNNTGLGFRAGQNTNGGTVNTFVGAFAGMANVNGSNNTVVGARSSAPGAMGSGNILLGANLDLLTTSTSNEINLGGLIFYNNASVAAPAVTACGTSPSIDAHANNRSGTVTVGTVAAASCTVTFAGSGYTTWNHCRVTSQTTLAAFAYSYTKTVLTVTGTSLVGDLFDYDCDGY